MAATTASLRGRRVLVTGASSGIGLATVRLLGDEGARLALLARGETGLAKAVAEARERGTHAVALQADVADAAAVERAVTQAVRALSGLDVVIANAGAAAYGPFERMAPEDFDRAIDVTFRGAVHTIRSALPALRASAGTLIVTGSFAGREPLPMMSPYAAAKHALRGFVSSLRVELLAEGSPISVCIVDPGPVDTPFWRSVATSEARLPRALPLAYEPESVAKALVACARKPRAQVTVGATMTLFGIVASVARPLSDRLAALAMRWDQNGGEPRPAARRGALWEPVEHGETTGGLRSVPSAAVAVRELIER